MLPAVHREDILPTHKSALPPSPHGAKETRSQPLSTDKGFSEVSMNQNSNKNTDKGFSRCFPKDDDSSESLGQQGVSPKENQP